MIVSYFSLKNTKDANKPNEDLVFYDEHTDLIILLDGVSRDKENGFYPNPSPAVDAVEIISTITAQQIENTLHAHSNMIGDELNRAILKANEKLNEYNLIHGLDFRAGAVGIFVIVSHNIALTITSYFPSSSLNNFSVFLE